MFYVFFFFHTKISVYIQLSLWKCIFSKKCTESLHNYYICQISLQSHNVPQCHCCRVLTIRVGIDKVGHMPVPGSHTGRQRLPQLQGEGILPLGELQLWYQFRSWESPSLLVYLVRPRWKVPSRCRGIHNVTAFHLIRYWVFNDLQWFRRSIKNIVVAEIWELWNIVWKGRTWDVLQAG